MGPHTMHGGMVNGKGHLMHKYISIPAESSYSQADTCNHRTGSSFVSYICYWMPGFCFQKCKITETRLLKRLYQPFLILVRKLGCSGLVWWQNEESVLLYWKTQDWKFVGARSRRDDPHYQRMKLSPSSMTVINDSAETAIALLQHYKSSLTRNMGKKLLLLCLVAPHNKGYPACSKATLMNTDWM